MEKVKEAVYKCKACGSVRLECTFCGNVYCPRDFKSSEIQSYDVCETCFFKVMNIHRELSDNSEEIVNNPDETAP